jgi:succinyl-CoA synthetase alpha subunit
MSILVNGETKVLVQGITGKTGTFFAQDMLKYGTKIVGGVTPGKGGIIHNGVPVFDSVLEAVQDTSAEASIIFVPAPFAKDSILEAIDAGLRVIVYPGENIPVHDMMLIKRRLQKSNSYFIGPNTPGIITPEESKVGFMPYFCYKRGNVGLTSRSGSLSYEIAYSLTRRGIGQSTAVGIGGDSVKGMEFVDVIGLFQEDPETKVIVLVGEIGGTDEERAAELIAEKVTKPTVAFITGKSAPLDKKMGHASAIVGEGRGTFESKIRALEEAGVMVATTPSEVPKLVEEVLSS